MHIILIVYPNEEIWILYCNTASNQDSNTEQNNLQKCVIQRFKRKRLLSELRPIDSQAPDTVNQLMLQNGERSPFRVEKLLKMTSAMFVNLILSIFSIFLSFHPPPPSHPSITVNSTSPNSREQLGLMSSIHKNERMENRAQQVLGTRTRPH